MRLFAIKEPTDLLKQNISRLSRDDYNSLLIVSKIRRAIRYEVDSAKIVDFIKKEYDYHLNTHFTEEETLLFSKLPHNDPLRMQAQRQHDHLKYMVWVCCNETKIPACLPEDFANRLEEHIRFEERTLFPYIKKILQLNHFENNPKDVLIPFTDN